jgi:hypothetical protein
MRCILVQYAGIAIKVVQQIRVKLRLHCVDSVEDHSHLTRKMERKTDRLRKYAHVYRATDPCLSHLFLGWC